MSSPATQPQTARIVYGPSNRLCLDYAAASSTFAKLPFPIIDVHTHVGGFEAARVYQQVAGMYGIGLTYSMTHLEELERVREVLGDKIRFIAVPNYQAEDRRYHFAEGFVKRIEQFHAAGARIVKFWAAPRGIDYARELGDPSFMSLDAPHRLDAMERARELGMYFMVHVSDPDTWFKTRYADATTYGTKPQQYEPLERLLDRFDQPWIAAHFGGWPEDLEFLTGLLQRHDNLYLDSSATKWMVRELSRHSRSNLLTFLRRFRGRVLFGSDIVVNEEHLGDSASHEQGKGARSQEEAMDLYASRYWALRTMFETPYVGESPIADPDLALVDPERYGELDAPPLLGKSLPIDVLQDVYFDAAHKLLEPLHSAHPTAGRQADASPA